MSWIQVVMLVSETVDISSSWPVTARDDCLGVDGGSDVDVDLGDSISDGRDMRLSWIWE